MARDITRCDRCGIDVAKGTGVAIKQTAGNTWEKDGMRSEPDLCEDCGKKQSALHKVFMTEDIDDDE